MDNAIDRAACHKTSAEELKATEEQKALMTQILEEFKTRFPDTNPMYIPILLLSIDRETWTYPEIFHYGPIAPQIEFIEKNEALRKLMQKPNS